MEKKDGNYLLKEPDSSYGNDTYADYLTWEMEEMVELIIRKRFQKSRRSSKENSTTFRRSALHGSSPVFKR